MTTIQIDDLVIRLPSDTHNTFNPTYAFGGRSNNNNGACAVIGLRDAESRQLLLPMDAEGSIVVIPGRKYHVVSIVAEGRRQVKKSGNDGHPQLSETPNGKRDKGINEEGKDGEGRPSLDTVTLGVGGSSSRSGQTEDQRTERRRRTSPRLESQQQPSREQLSQPAKKAMRHSTHNEDATGSGGAADDTGDKSFAQIALANGTAATREKPDTGSKRRKGKDDVEGAMEKGAAMGADEHSASGDEPLYMRFAPDSTPSSSQIPSRAPIQKQKKGEETRRKRKLLSGSSSSASSALATPIASPVPSPLPVENSKKRFNGSAGNNGAGAAREPAAVKGSPTQVPVTLPPSAHNSGVKRPRPPIESSSDSD